MKEFNIYRVDTFLLGDEWIEKGSFGRISYVIRGGENENLHKEKVDELKKKLLYDNDDTYTSWVFTHEVYKNINGYNPHVSIIQFRVRDAG